MREGIMDCQDIAFSKKQSQKRIEKALQVIPLQVLKKIMFFALYILGVKINTIASLVKIPEESGRTTVSRVMKDGIYAFHDRRQSAKSNKMQRPHQQGMQTTVSIEDTCCTITFGKTEHSLIIPKSHRVHLRAVLLSLLQANLLTVHTVSSALGITDARCRELSKKLISNGVSKVLVDKRQGQKQDFLVDKTIKAELIQNFAARAVTGYSISSHALAAIINNIKKTNISSRTIRWHMNKMGLMKIKKTLPKLVETLKKKI